MSEHEPEPSDEELLRRARDGDQGAWETLRRRHWDRLHAAALRRLAPLLRRRVGASDVVQEALLALFRSLPRIEIDPGGTSAWLDAVVDFMVRRAFERHWRTKRRSLRSEAQGPVDWDAVHADTNQPTPSAEATAIDEAARTNRAIDRLPEDDRLVVRLRNWEGLTFPEIAEVVGKREDAVRVQYSRALTKLRGYLGDDPRDAT